MPCYRPIDAYHSKEVNASGKRSIVFNPAKAEEPDRLLKIACGQCVGCRLERSRRWAVRCMHESQMHDLNSFLTLTYSDEFLPAEGTVVLKHFQDFMKRLRKKVGKVRFFHCGEYGEKLSRPHYHCILFGYDFPDKIKVDETHDGFDLWKSEMLEKLWGKGICRVGDVTFESAAYVARYITKKITGPEAHWFYNEIDFSTGEILRELKPEYVTMSRRPGIGKTWFEKYKGDLFPRDFCLIKRKGRYVKCSVPKYYDTALGSEDPEMLEKVVDSRKRDAAKFSDNNTPERLKVREEIHERKFEVLKRSLEKC